MLRFVVDGGIVAQQNNNNMWLAISCIYLPGISTRIAWCVCPCEEKGEREVNWLERQGQKPQSIAPVTNGKTYRLYTPQRKMGPQKDR